MKRALLASVLAIAVPSCTIVLGATGGGIAAYHNSDVPDDRPDDEYSTIGFIFGGMLLGALIDAAIIMVAAKQWSRPMT